MEKTDRSRGTYNQLFQSHGYNRRFTQMRADLRGRVALITGAAGMIGGEAASLYAACGARIAVWDINDEAGAAKIEAINGQGGEALYYHVDVADQEAVEAAVKQVCLDFDGIDILLANAGINSSNRKPVTEMDEALFDRNMDVNLTGGTIWLTKLVLPHMMERGGGNIIFTSSVCGVTGLRYQCGYVASKFAISALTRSLALEYGKYHIRVNALAPGAVPEPDGELSFLWRNCSFDHFEENFSDPDTMLFDIPARRPGHPKDMAGLLLYFASDDADFTTGQVVCVDGGWTAGLSGDY